MRKLFAPFALYKRDAVLSVIGTVGEVVMEVFIPFITAYLIDRGIEAGIWTPSSSMAGSCSSWRF